MALAIRLSRGGRRNLPFYRVVVADTRAPRDGRYIERLGTYNPLLPQDNDNRVNLNTERVQYWLSQGAKPSERVAVFLGKAGLAPMPAHPQRPDKSKPKAKAQQRLIEKEEKRKAAEEAAAAAKEIPAETPAEVPGTEPTEVPPEKNEGE
ncbi:MAG: 30S ribosomal protein S16 [Alphaproteobacteria bacterium]|nr:30S ribosomal protein S16 [Alphaproteobacteria bacterium]